MGFTRRITQRFLETIFRFVFVNEINICSVTFFSRDGSKPNKELGRRPKEGTLPLRRGARLKYKGELPRRISGTRFFQLAQSRISWTWYISTNGTSLIWRRGSPSISRRGSCLRNTQAKLQALKAEEAAAEARK